MQGLTKKVKTLINMDNRAVIARGREGGEVEKSIGAISRMRLGMMNTQ